MGNDLFSGIGNFRMDTRVPARTPEPFDQESGVHFLRLNKGGIAYFDSEDAARISVWSWSFYDRNNRRYARANIRGEGGKRWYSYMHSFIMMSPKGMEVDHIDGDGLNNRRTNLRICTHQQNMMNIKKSKQGSSQFKGVNWFAPSRKWRAYIVIDAKQRHLGYFSDEFEAARAYDKAAKSLYGEFARLNFPNAKPSVETP